MREFPASMDTSTAISSGNKAIELADLHRFLERLSQIDGYAVNHITPSERPDFILDVNGREIGVEVTRSVYQESVRALQLQAEKFPTSWVNLTNCVDDGPRRHNDDLTRSILSQSPKSRTVESSMLGWQHRLATRLASKRGKLNQAEYRRFTENWLLIQDVPPPFIDQLNYGPAVEPLHDLFQQSSGVAKDFDAIFINSEDLLLRWRDGQLVCARFDNFQRGG